MTLSHDIESFIRDGYVAIPVAFPRALADQCRAILWQAMGLDPDRPETWTKPVVRLDSSASPFHDAANTPRLHPRLRPARRPRPLAAAGLGTFPVRFPSAEDPGDAGWHIDVSFGIETPDFMEWRANVYSKGRALLMLFLLLRRRRGRRPDPHPRRLAPRHRPPTRSGGRSGPDACANWPPTVSPKAPRREVPRHRRRRHRLSLPPLPGPRRPAPSRHGPRFMAQPPLLPREPLALDRADGDYSPVERAIRKALGMVAVE